MSRKLTILSLDEISISNSGNLKALKTFLCTFDGDVLGPLLSGMKMRPSSLYKPSCLRSIILSRVPNI